MLFFQPVFLGNQGYFIVQLKLKRKSSEVKSFPELVQNFT